MTDPRDPATVPPASPAEREWHLQEAARLAHRAGDPREEGGRAAHYRRIAEALDQPPEAALPSHFAYATAQRIEALAAERRRADARFVRRLRLAFAFVYGGAMVAVVLANRTLFLAWLAQPDVQRLVASPWWPWLVACAALSWLLQAGAGRVRKERPR